MRVINPLCAYEGQTHKGFVPGGFGSRIFFAVWRIAERIFPRIGHMHLGNPSRIVVARFGHLGDGVLATAVLVPLREAWPEASIDVVCYSSASSVFMAHPSVRRVFSSPLFDAESPLELVKAISWRDFCNARDFLHRTDRLLLLNHIVSPGGYLKYLLLLGCRF